MNLKLAFKALFASSLLVAPGVAEVEQVNENVPGKSREEIVQHLDRLTKEPDELKGKQEEIDRALKAMNEVLEGLGVDSRNLEDAEEDGYGGDYYGNIVHHLVFVGHQIKAYQEAHRAQLAYGLDEVKGHLYDAAYSYIAPHDFTHDHEAHTDRVGTHDHGAYRGKLSGYTEKYSGGHDHTIYVNNNGDHMHNLPKIKCRCAYDRTIANATTAIAGEHYHGAHVKKGGEHGHGVKVDFMEDGDHSHNVTVKESTDLDYITHKTDLFDDLGSAADALWDLIQGLKKKIEVKDPYYKPEPYYP
uniref:Uncharacterized protein n=1 Tax=Pseudictyota dubia TaxID=2749911 RepID=A0A7R9W7A4_9STRA|mmetsp:Transcript_36736/g.68028  ORF Transcript_36736/g.68028 Transcript_36736/m.68028 type:complete len:301 (+) Transcript_36736:123-1025(+)